VRYALKNCLTQLIVPMIILAMAAMASSPLPTEASPAAATRSVTQALPVGESYRDLGLSGAGLPTARVFPGPKSLPIDGLDFDPSERSPSISDAKAPPDRSDRHGAGEKPVLRLCLTVGGVNAGLLPFPLAALALDPSGGVGAEGSHGPSHLFGPDEKLQPPLGPKFLLAAAFPPPVSADANAARFFGKPPPAVAHRLKSLITAGLSLFGPWSDRLRRAPTPSPMDGLFPTPEPRTIDGLGLASLERGPSLSLAKAFGSGSPSPEAGLDPFPEMAINGSHGPATAFVIPAGVFTAEDAQKPLERVLGAFIEAYPKTRPAASLRPYLPKSAPEGSQDLGPRRESKPAGAIWASSQRASKDNPIAVTSGLLRRPKEGGSGLGLPSPSGSKAKPGLVFITSTVRPNDAGILPGAITDRPSRRPPNSAAMTLVLGFSALPSRIGVGLAASRRTRGPSP
jgi:hypothetical protein